MIVDHAKLEELKASGRLPSPKGAALQVLQLCQKDDVTNQEVASAIQCDAALSARLIKLANSPLSHQVRPIVSVTDAVTVLGRNTVRQIVLALSLIDSSRNLSCKNFNYENFWSHSLLRGIAAQSLVTNSCAGVVPPEEVFVLGLLADVGSLTLATAFPEEYSAILGKEAVVKNVNLNEIERTAFGIDHNQLSKAMFADWRMPITFQSAILHFEDPASANIAEGCRDWCLLHLLHVAEYLAKTCLADPGSREKLVPKLVFKAARLGVETNGFSTLADQIVQDWHAWSKLFNLRVTDVPSFGNLLDVAPLAPERSDVSEIPGNIVPKVKLKILIVDDDRAVLMVLKLILDSAGHTVFVAQNGAEALAMINEVQPQVIMTDWVMPVMDGIEFCKAVRKNPDWRNIYVFILTSLESADRLVEAFDAGANDYMTKPVNPKVLGARLGGAQRIVQLQEELSVEREQLRKYSAELADSNRRLQKLALTDELTGLPNRRFANEHLERQWAVAERNHSALSCMMVDIDFFKQVNDTYGHKVGDDALRQVASVLQKSVRKQDVVSRLGGEEFMIVCPDIKQDMIFAYAERLRENISKTVMSDQLSAKSFHLTVSIGAASKNDGINSAEMLMQLADARLYSAKQKGRNCTVAE